MKYFLAILSLTLAIGPAAATAQTAAPAPMPGASGQRWPDRRAFGTFMRREQQLRTTFRTQVLSALTSAHRSAVASVIGNLAISSNPDPRAAAQRIDALLDQSEREQILAARDTFERSSRSLHDQMRAQMAQQMNTSFPSPPPRPMRTPSNDAGRVLMMALVPFGAGFGPMHGMGGPGMNGMPPGGPPPNGAPPNGAMPNGPPPGNGAPPPDGAPPQP